MNILDRNKAYNKYISAKTPITKWFPSLFIAFAVGGLICCIGEGIGDIIKIIFKSISDKDTAAWVSIILILLASFLTGLGIYDKIGVFSGAGSIVPITGFSNSVTSPAMEFKPEGLIFGTCSKMFTVAGPVIVNGVAVSILIGIIYLIFA